MRISIAQKIFAIAAVVLTLMLAVSVHAIVLTSRIADDLESVSQRQVPLSEEIARISVRILGQGVALQRHLAFSEAGDQAGAARALKRFEDLTAEVEVHFERARQLLDATPEDGRHGRKAIRVLGLHLEKIHGSHRAFLRESEEVVSTAKERDEATLAVLVPRLNTHQDIIDGAITAVRREAARLADQAVKDAERDEKLLLVSNFALTALAAVLALVLAASVTRLLVRGVRNLVAGTEAVEQGDLDTEVPITSRDEVGQLTGSFNHMIGELRIKERIKETFGRYVDPRVVKQLIDKPVLAEPHGERREMTVMFMDLKGFTSISELLPPDDLVGFINGFFSHMTEAVSSHGGVVDKFMGDAVMAYWGPPFCAPGDHARLACEAALDALNEMDGFRADVARTLGKTADDLDVDVRIGISSGEMVVGTVGSKATMSFTVMGDPVNLSARLEGANKSYGTRLIISDETRTRAGDAFAYRELDLIQVKGKSEPTRIFELIGAKGEEPLMPISAAAAFETGLKAYRAQSWDLAEQAFRGVLLEAPMDGAASAFLERVRQLRIAPPGPGWDGVWVFETK